MGTLLKIAVFTYLIVISALPLKATNYYFSSFNGSDNNSGLSASSPKSSVNAIKAVLGLLQPGDTIFLERGSIWHQSTITLSGKQGTVEQPIVFTAYGTGRNPILSGQKILSSPQQDENIYTFNDPFIPYVFFTSKSFGRRFPGYVTLDDKPYYPSRYPKQGYLKSTYSNRIAITDNSQSWPVNHWKDGWIGVKSVKWNWSDVRITSNTANVLNTTEHSAYTPFGSKCYFIFNAYNAMSQDGEWASKEGSLSVYWSNSDLPEVKVSVVDRIMTISSCKYIHFNNIDFVGANIACIRITNSDYNKIDRCRLIGSGEFGVYIGGSPTGPPYHGDTENNEVTFCEIADCGSAAIYSRYCRGGIFTNNYIHRISIFPGYQNIYDSETSDGCYAITVWNNIALTPVVRQNYLDSVCGGITNHYNGYTFVARENFIRNYGMGDLSDIGGFYVVSDPFSTVNKKNINKNFFVDVYEPSGAQENLYSDSYTHAVYFDQDSYGVKADSNSIENADVALMTNGGKARSFNYNNILYPGIHHHATIVNSYLLSLQGGSRAEADTIIHNNVVFGNTGETGYTFLRVSNSYGCVLPLKGQIDYNKWFDPSGTSSIIAKVYEGYSLQYSYTLPQWQTAAYNCSEIPIDPGDSSIYNNTAYKAVRLLKNWSAKDRTFPIDANYIDVDGNEVSDSVRVPAFFSKLIFQVSGEETQSDLYIDSTLVPQSNYPGPNHVFLTSFERINNSDKINYFPVPVIKELNIDNIPNLSTISVYNMVGVKLAEYENVQNGKTTINMANLKSGIYLVSIKCQNKILKSFKVTKR